MWPAKVIRCTAFLAFVATTSYGYPNPAGDALQEHNYTVAASEPKAAASDNANFYRQRPQEPEAEVDERDAYLEQQSDQSQLQEQEEHYQRSQTYYPSFSPYANPPLGHSRPFLYQEGAYSQRPDVYRQQLTTYDGNGFNGFRGDSRDGRERAYNTHTAAATANSDTHGLLGSGNFGVIRGGTFYSDSDGDSSSTDHEQRQIYNPYYHNGHGRPSFYFGANPRPTQHEQFANFRDFADINTPANSAYSQYVIVYANKNSTAQHDDGDVSSASSSLFAGGKKEPKNIFERLAMIDLEAQQQHSSQTTEAAAEQKLSKAKAKLALLKPEKKYRLKKIRVKQVATSSKELHEPLLALS